MALGVDAWVESLSKPPLQQRSFRKVRESRCLHRCLHISGELVCCFLNGTNHGNSFLVQCDCVGGLNIACGHSDLRWSCYAPDGLNWKRFIEITRAIRAVVKGHRHIGTVTRKLRKKSVAIIDTLAAWEGDDTCQVSVGWRARVNAIVRKRVRCLC
jgi:hypothetical protein